jgi:hypothetical protein
MQHPVPLSEGEFTASDSPDVADWVVQPATPLVWRLSKSCPRRLRNIRSPAICVWRIVGETRFSQVHGSCRADEKACRDPALGEAPGFETQHLSDLSHG